MRGAKVSQITPLNSPGAAGKGSGAEHRSSAVGLGRGGRLSGMCSLPLLKYGHRALELRCTHVC